MLKMLAAVIGLLILTVCSFVQPSDKPVRIGKESYVPENPRSRYNRYINWRPADGEVVQLNPPRISWPYWPDFPNNWNEEVHAFRLQISSNQDMSTPLVDVACDFNFYNTIPALDPGKEWYWRVGYDIGTPNEVWREVRSFRIARDATIWDRSSLAHLNLAERGHPRVLLQPGKLKRIKGLAQTVPGSREALTFMQTVADSILQSQWYQEFPQNDSSSYPKEAFYQIAEGLVTVAFLWRITDDEKYAGVKERAVRLASFPPGGRASPEGLVKGHWLDDAEEDATQTNEFLALLFDWLYNDLSDSERKIMIYSLEWRVDHFMNTFSWKNNGKVSPRSLSGCSSSHQFEGSMDTAVSGLVLYEHSEIGRKWTEFMLNYIIGITSAHGFDGAWNEGAGYGASKLKWLTNASIYYDTALPDARLGKNPIYSRIGEFFRRLIPVGMPHHAWGNQHNSMWRNHLAAFRKLAYLTGDGLFLGNWKEYGGKTFSDFRPWIEYTLPAYYRQPQAEYENKFVGFFPIDGWGMAATGPPSKASTFANGLGFAFASRTRGAFSHAFYADNSFILHAYGQNLNHGGAGSNNQDSFADHTMSHNTLLIDGLGQAQLDTRYGQVFPTYARIVGFAQGENYVYFAGDATRAYPRTPGTRFRKMPGGTKVYAKMALPYLDRFIRHILFLRQKYLVVFDDLASSQPATYTWLYHILPDDPIRFDPASFSIDYRVGDVEVRLQHIARIKELVLDDRKGLDGYINPFTGEDYRPYRKGDILGGHNLWISNKEKAETWNYLTVIYPKPPNGEIPLIKALDNFSVQVGKDIISFDATSPFAVNANFLVDVNAMSRDD